MHRIIAISIFAILSVAFLTGCNSNASELELNLCEEPDAEAISADKGAEALEDMVDESDISRDSEEELFVYVCGAVKSPGVYSFSAGTRVYEAVNTAGGFTGEAETEALNLAQPLRDGEQLYVPTISETREAGGTAYAYSRQAGSGGANPSEALVNINTAGASELTSINGIGESRAADIISYREQNGGFTSIEDIMKVPGIKDGLFNKIKDKITV